MRPILGLRTFNNEFVIAPGGVGSVGQTAVQERMRRSCPEQAVIIQSRVTDGSNITDGNNMSMLSIGPGARTIEEGWNFREGWQTNRGFVIEDLRALPRTQEPLTVGPPQSDWQNTVATTFQTIGKGFALPKPFVPGPTTVLRGQQPRVFTVSQPNAAIPDWGVIAKQNIR